MVLVIEVKIFSFPIGYLVVDIPPGVRVSETASDLVYFAHSYLTYLLVSPLSATLPSAIARNLYSACFALLLPGPQLPILYPIADTALKKEFKCSRVLQTSTFINHSPL